MKNRGTKGLRALLMFLAAVFPSAKAHAGEVLRVSVAASLADAVEEAAAIFSRGNPGVKVLVNRGASGALVAQMENGAPVDLFLSADSVPIDRARAARLVVPGSIRTLTGNRLVLAVPAANPGNVRSLGDLLSPAVRRVGMGNPDYVPAGTRTREALSAAGLWPAIGRKAVLGVDARQILDYLRRGEVEAGFVYFTDARSVPEEIKVVETIGSRTPISYLGAVTAGSARPAMAQRFLLFLAGEDGREVFVARGFTEP